MVTADQRANYERYTFQNQGWIQESRELELRGRGDLDTTVYQNAPISPFLYTRNMTGGFTMVPAKKVRQDSRVHSKRGNTF